MKTYVLLQTTLIIFLSFTSCGQKGPDERVRIMFLHHSTGKAIWNGAASSPKNADLPLLFEGYNKENNRNYAIKEMEFPKLNPYGWNNYPYDYYNIWIKHAGEKPFLEEPTLEILTKDYQMIVFKHCFPVSNIQHDSVSQDIHSDIKTIANYKFQYEALRHKLLQFPQTKFLLWTGPIQVKSLISEAEAKRAQEFFTWVKEEWDLPDDNIYLWDFYSIETNDSLYLREEYSVSPSDSHPNKALSGKAVNMLFKRIIDILETNGNETKITGEVK